MPTLAKYGAPKLEIYVAYHFNLKNHSFLCPRKIILRVDNQPLARLKTYSTYQAINGRWIMALEKYHFQIEHQPQERKIETHMDLASERTTTRIMNDHPEVPPHLRKMDGKQH